MNLYSKVLKICLFLSLIFILFISLSLFYYERNLKKNNKISGNITYLDDKILVIKADNSFKVFRFPLKDDIEIFTLKVQDINEGNYRTFRATKKELKVDSRVIITFEPEFFIKSLFISNPKVKKIEILS